MPAMMQPKARHSVATVLATRVVRGAMWWIFCSRAGVIRMTTTMPADSIHVSSIETTTAPRWLRSTDFKGISVASALRCCISAKTGVSCSQRRRYMAPKPKMPPSRNG
ncbi:hypothetical protein D3C81_1688050 [compost metagenome]